MLNVQSAIRNPQSPVDIPRWSALHYAAYGSIQIRSPVAWVIEESLRTGERPEFWVLTSLEELTAEERRKLAHWRWDIENNGFKSLNSLVHTKHLCAHDLHAAEAMTLLLFIAGTVLQLFLGQISREDIEALFGRVKLTRKFLQEQLRVSVEALPAPDT